MDEGARKWLFKTAYKNFWRVHHYMDVDDLIQEGYVQYARVIARYPEATDAAHIMRLFQIMYTQRLNILATQRTREREIIDEIELQSFDSFEPEGGTLQALIAQAPAPVAALIKLLQSDNGCKRLRAAYRRRRTGERETTNERLCRLVGLDPTACDLPAMVKAHFGKG
jgi:hypothetical protein